MPQLLATGRSYHYVDLRPSKAPRATLLCVHGFPDLAYGWRNQMSAWVEQGYRVIAPDMLGYGKTDMPLETSAYSTKRLCDDLAALLDHLDVQQAVVVGHDWGAYIAGRFALWHPDRLLALALLSIPYTPPLTDCMSLEEIVERYPSFGYQLYFASEQSTAEIEAHLPLFLRLLYRKPSQENPSLSRKGELQDLLRNGKEPAAGCLLKDNELEVYISNFQRGMIGPLSYYRTTQFRFEEEKDAALPSKLRADLPVLLLYGTEDPTCRPDAVKNMGKFINRLKVVPMPGMGHWITLQDPQTVTEAILEWLESVLVTRTLERL